MLICTAGEGWYQEEGKAPVTEKEYCELEER